MVNKNASVIISLCSFILAGDDIKPYKPSEWSKLAENLLFNNLEPINLYDFSDDDYKKILGYDSDEIYRIKRLLDRTGSLAFKISEYEKMGIKIVTRADKEYPKVLKKNLGKLSPPLFYYVGDIEIANSTFIGFVGSRSVNENDIEVTSKIVKNVVNNKYSIVSGGAKGIDSIASEDAIANGGIAMEFLSDSLIRKIKDPKVNKYVREQRLLVLSAAKPDAGFNVGNAMARNKYIYASSIATVVMKADFKKGGSWAGAIEALKNKWTNVYCWKNEEYKGNMELIEKGALPIYDTEWKAEGVLKIVKEQAPKDLFSYNKGNE